MDDGVVTVKRHVGYARRRAKLGDGYAIEILIAQKQYVRLFSRFLCHFVVFF